MNYASGKGNTDEREERTKTAIHIQEKRMNWGRVQNEPEGQKRKKEDQNMKKSECG